jgi:hypothetical protein
MFNIDPKVKESILEKSKKIKIQLTESELYGIGMTMSMIFMSCNSDQKAMDRQIYRALGSVMPGRKMNEMLSKGIEIEYTDGSKQILKNK